MHIAGEQRDENGRFSGRDCREERIKSGLREGVRIGEGVGLRGSGRMVRQKRSPDDRWQEPGRSRSTPTLNEFSVRARGQLALEKKDFDDSKGAFAEKKKRWRDMSQGQPGLRGGRTTGAASDKKLCGGEKATRYTWKMTGDRFLRGRRGRHYHFRAAENSYPS